LCCDYQEDKVSPVHQEAKACLVQEVSRDGKVTQDSQVWLEILEDRDQMETLEQEAHLVQLDQQANLEDQDHLAPEDLKVHRDPQDQLDSQDLVAHLDL